MAKKKSDIRSNEDYMNHVALNAFANRMRAVQKKENYIWSTSKFRSQDIYENSKKESEVEENNQFSLRGGQSDRKQADSHRRRQSVRERYHKQISESIKYEAAISHKDHQHSMDVDNLDTEKRTKSVKEMPKTCQWNKSISSKQDISGKNHNFASGMITAKNTDNGQFNEQVKKGPRPHSSQMIDDYQSSKTKSMSKFSYERKLPEATLTTQNILKRKQLIFSSVGSIVVNEYQQPRDCHNSSAQKIEQDNFIRKRTRLDFKLPEKDNSPNVQINSLDNKVHWAIKQNPSEVKCISEASEETTKSLLCIKIWKNAVYQEFPIFMSNFDKIKKKYPKLSEVMPDIDAEEKEINFCVDAVKAIMKYLFQPPYNFDVELEERLVIEILAASRSWEILDFRSDFQKYFLKNFLSRSNIEKLYLLAQHFGESEICDACRNLTKDGAFVNLKAHNYGQKTCCIKIDSYDEPLEFPIQLAEGTGKDCLTESLPTDISNEIIFEAISGSYAIKGFEITLNGDFKADNLPALKISYDATNNDENISVHEQKSKPQRSKIVIHLKKKLIVNPHQRGKITVETHIKPSSCFVLKSKKIIEENPKGKFSLSMTTTRKNQLNEKRFLVGKLLYNYL